MIKKPKNKSELINDYILGRLKIRFNKKTGDKMPGYLVQEVWSKTHNILIDQLERNLFEILIKSIKEDLEFQNKEYIEYCKKNPTPKKIKPIKRRNHDIPI